jgi:hypothetical protein
MRGRDIDEVMQIMLARDDWESVQVHGYAIDRRWLEVASSYF